MTAAVAARSGQAGSRGQGGNGLKGPGLRTGGFEGRLKTLVVLETHLGVRQDAAVKNDGVMVALGFPGEDVDGFQDAADRVQRPMRVGAGRGDPMLKDLIVFPKAYDLLKWIHQLTAKYLKSENPHLYSRS